MYTEPILFGMVWLTMEDMQPYGENPEITGLVMEKSVKIGDAINIIVSYKARDEGRGVKYFYWLSLTGVKERGVESDATTHQFRVVLPVTRELASLLLKGETLKLFGFASITVIRPEDFQVQCVKRLNFEVKLEDVP